MGIPQGPPSGLPPNPIHNPIGAAEYATRQYNDRAAAAMAAGLIQPSTYTPRALTAMEIAEREQKRAEAEARTLAAAHRAELRAAAIGIESDALAAFFSDRAEIRDGVLVWHGRNYSISPVPGSVVLAALRALRVRPTDKVKGYGELWKRGQFRHKRSTRFRGWVAGSYSGVALSTDGRVYWYDQHPTWDTAYAKGRHDFSFGHRFHGGKVGADFGESRLEALRDRIRPQLH